MSRKAVEMEHLTPYGGSVSEPGGRAPIVRTLERHVTKSFGKPQARSKIGLSQYVYRARVPSGHNTLRRNLYIMGLLDRPSYKGCGEEEETSTHVLCE
jgi:hypothetical protein